MPLFFKTHKRWPQVKQGGGLLNLAGNIFYSPPHACFDEMSGARGAVVTLEAEKAFIVGVTSKY